MHFKSQIFIDFTIASSDKKLLKCKVVNRKWEYLAFWWSSIVEGQSDMENVQNFTRAGLLISRFYPKVRELRQFQNCDKTV